MKSNNALAVAATAGIAAIALLAVLRADSMKRRSMESRRAARDQLDRWDDEGGNIPEVTLASGEQGSGGKPA